MPHPNKPAHDALVPVAEVARLLGRHPATIRRWRSRPDVEMPTEYRLPGGGVAYLKSDVLAWRESLRSTPKPSDD